MTEIEIPRLQKLYNDKGITDLIDAFSYQNRLEVPKINKVVLNMGIGAVSYTHLTLPTKA